MNRRRLAMFASLPALPALPTLLGCGVGVRQSTGASAEREAPRIEVQAAYEAITAGRAVLIDVRSETSYLQKRAAGAVLLPLDQIELAPAEAARRIAAGKQPILYCT